MSIVLMVHNNWMACFDKKKTARDIRFNFTTMCEFFKKRHYVQKTEQTDYGKGRNHHSYYIFIIYLKSTHTLSAKSLATRTRYLRSKLCRRCRWLLGYTFFREYLRELEKIRQAVFTCLYGVQVNFFKTKGWILLTHFNISFTEFPNLKNLLRWVLAHSGVRIFECEFEYLDRIEKKWFSLGWLMDRK